MPGILTELRWRELLPGQRSEIWTMDIDSGEQHLVFACADRVLEAPNWSPDGRWLVVNSAGSLFRLPARDAHELQFIETGHITDNNNDHLISRDGAVVYTSSELSGQIYAVPLDGGEPQRVSNDSDAPFGYFLQGVSPDGSLLAYAGGEQRGEMPLVMNLFTIAAHGGSDVRLTDWDTDAVGCEFSPDGTWLYFNSEHEAQSRGHMQLYRMRTDGTGIECLSRDERPLWFPKPSPDGSVVIYLAFPTGTVGHGANLPVTIRAMDPDGQRHRDVVRLHGGQGTLNVNNWAPDGRRFAYISYPAK